MAYSRILISVDSHECSFAVAKKGIELAHALKAKAALLFVVDTAKAVGNVEAGIFPPEALILLKKEAQQTLDQLASMYEGQDIMKFMPEGHPAEDIIRTAVNWEADLIIVGTHGKKGLAKWLSVSEHVSDYVLHHSKVPVLLIPPVT
jgi:nucleotide-binding universal stress UspA family protein